VLDDIETAEHAQQSEKLSMNLLTNIKKPSEAAFLSALLHYARKLALKGLKY